MIAINGIHYDYYYYIDVKIRAILTGAKIGDRFRTLESQINELLSGCPKQTLPGIPDDLY